MSIGEYEETEGKKESACRSGGGGSCHDWADTRSRREFDGKVATATTANNNGNPRIAT